MNERFEPETPISADHPSAIKNPVLPEHKAKGEAGALPVGPLWVLLWVKG
jgi:hypothetical protein